jgi:hypothetical protein
MKGLQSIAKSCALVDSHTDVLSSVVGYVVDFTDQ